MRSALEPGVCPHCGHYFYLHPCRGLLWRARRLILPLPFGAQLQLLRACRCRHAP